MTYDGAGLEFEKTLEAKVARLEKANAELTEELREERESYRTLSIYYAEGVEAMEKEHLLCHDREAKLIKAMAATYESHLEEIAALEAELARVVRLRGQG